MTYPSTLKRSLPDIALCLLLAALAWLFYWPQTDVLHSHYTTVTMVFERSARLVNPNYTDHFQNLKAEACWPLPNLMANGCMRIFHSNLEHVLIAYHSFFILLSLFATYWANRLFFLRAPAFALTTLYMFGRIILPLGRGMGITPVPLLLPLLLFFIHHLAHTQNRDDSRCRRVLPAAVVAVSLACMLTLGGHETTFAIAVFAVLLPLLALDWANRSRQAKRFLPGPTLPTIAAVIAGLVLAVAIMLVSRQAVAPEQDRASISQTFSFGYIGRETQKRIATEPSIGNGHKTRIFRGTFIEGRFLTLEPGKFYHRHEERTFLYPGRGFNGILPLAVIPGFLLGLWVLAQRTLLLFQRRQNDGPRSRRQRYFILLLVALLVHFVGILAITASPKPSRYSLCVYAVLGCAVFGYTRLFAFCKRIVAKAAEPLNWPDAKRRRIAVWGATLIVLLPLLCSLEARLLKNYRDLQIYFDHYWIQARTKAMAPVFFAAQNAFADRHVVVTYYWKNWPEQGLLLRYRALKNVTMYERFTDIERIDFNAVYFIWQDRGRENSFFKVRRGDQLPQVNATTAKPPHRQTPRTRSSPPAS